VKVNGNRGTGGLARADERFLGYLLTHAAGRGEPTK
jgi:hypothetical protein